MIEKMMHFGGIQESMGSLDSARDDKFEVEIYSWISALSS
jgi:hypothetical protein